MNVYSRFVKTTIFFTNERPGMIGHLGSYTVRNNLISVNNVSNFRWFDSLTVLHS